MAGQALNRRASAPTQTHTDSADTHKPACIYAQLQVHSKVALPIAECLAACRFYLVFAAVEATYLSSTAEKVPTGACCSSCAGGLPCQIEGCKCQI